MNETTRTVALRAAALGALAACLSGCGFLSVPRPPNAGTVTLLAARPAMLIIITNPDSPAAMRETAALIASTARTGERVVILSDAGATLTTSVAPPPPAVRVPAKPAPLGPQPTSFQKARYAAALHQYTSAVRHAESTLSELERTELAAWASRTVASAQARQTPPRDSGTDIAASISAAAADLSSLRQIGDATGAVIAIVGIDEAAAWSGPVPLTGLQGSTVVADDFPGGAGAEASWQASLLQAGAGRVTLLTHGTDDQLPTVVRQALDGAITDTLTNVLFGLGQYRLSPAALPQLGALLRLLTVSYPDATATIIGYTDDLPTPGGNQRLSELRAQAVARWLVAHRVAASRLQAFGDGDADPVAPNTPAGQPLDRRVDVIIDPAVP